MYAWCRDAELPANLNIGQPKAHREDSSFWPQYSGGLFADEKQPPNKRSFCIERRKRRREKPKKDTWRSKAWRVHCKYAACGIHHWRLWGVHLMKSSVVFFSVVYLWSFCEGIWRNTEKWKYSLPILIEYISMTSHLNTNFWLNID